MKICILSNQTRSMAIFWRVLISTFINKDIKVLCAAPPGDHEAERNLISLGATIRHYPLDRKGLNPLRDAASLIELYQMFRQEKPDLLFATTIKPVIYGCIAARMAFVPGIFATITGLGYAFEADTFLKKILNRLSILLYRVALGHATGIFFQNRDDEMLFKQKHIISQGPGIFLTQGTGVDIDWFSEAPFPPFPPAGPLIFLLVGRLLEAKGLPEYAKAAAMLKEKYPTAQFRLLGPMEHGPGSIDHGLLEKWRKSGVIDYLGETRDVRKYIEQSHVIVLPSWREGVPTSIMEAMSMGRPCVVTDVPGCREVVINGQNGWLAAPHNPESVAEAMEKFLVNPQSIPIMGKASRELAVSRFDAHKVAHDIISDIESVFPLKALSSKGQAND